MHAQDALAHQAQPSNEFRRPLEGISPSTSITQKVTDFPIMKSFRALSAVEQLATHLRREVMAGEFGASLPGMHRLARDLGVSPNTVVAAVAQLEQEGLLQHQGARRCARIAPIQHQVRKALQVRVLLYDQVDRSMPDMTRLESRLQLAGHRSAFASKTLQGLGMDPRKIANFVRDHPADAWVVCAGTHAVLEWFTTQSLPVFAMYGRHAALPIAGASPRKIPAMQLATRRLIALGHRRIVMLARPERLLPKPALFEQAFLDELTSQGIEVGAYHLPVWEDSVEGFHQGLDALFQYTPPTALIVCEAPQFAAAQQHLARRGIIAPERVSLICDDPDPHFDWYRPSVAHIAWNPYAVADRVLHWVDQLATGQDNKQKHYAVAEFVDGGTVGPVPNSLGSSCG